MEDHAIIALYHRRSEDAIAATDEKYGPPLPPPQPSGEKMKRLRRSLRGHLESEGVYL